MAMQIEKTLESGVTLMYHRVTRVRIDYPNKSAEVEVASYINKAARDEGKKPVMYFTHVVEGDIVLSGDARAISYQALSSDSQEYSGAIEV